MKKSILSSVYFGIFFEVLTHKTMAQIPLTFACPSVGDIIVSTHGSQNKEIQYQWTATNPAGNWIGQGQIGVESFYEAIAEPSGVNGTAITCRYITNNNIVKKNENKRDIRRGFSSSLQLGYIKTIVNDRSCKVDKDTISCIYRTQCPDPSYYTQYCNTLSAPPESGWSWTKGNCPVGLLTIGPPGVEIRDLYYVTCHYTDNIYSYQVSRDFSGWECYFSEHNKNGEQFCNDKDASKCKIKCIKP